MVNRETKRSARGRTSVVRRQTPEGAGQVRSPSRNRHRPSHGRWLRLPPTSACATPKRSQSAQVRKAERQEAPSRLPRPILRGNGDRNGSGGLSKGGSGVVIVGVTALGSLAGTAPPLGLSAQLKPPDRYGTAYNHYAFSPERRWSGLGKLPRTQQCRLFWQPPRLV